MPTFVSEGAEATCEDPGEDATVELVVQVDADQMTTTEEWIETHEGVIVDSLDHGLVEFELPEVHVPALCDLDFLRAVERADETIEVLDGGNGSTRGG